MNNFQPKRILNEREIVAEHLHQARENKNLKLETVAKKTKIKIEYLKAIEEGRLEALPSGLYGRNFIKEYALFLKEDFQELFDILDQADSDKIKKKQKNKDSQAKKFFAKQVIKAHKFIIAPKIFKSLAIAVIIGICFLYLGYYWMTIISPPKLLIIEPLENSITSDNFVNVVGLTDPETEIIINGKNVLCDREGNFSIKISLKDGLNSLVIVAKKRYGRESTVIRQVLVNE